MALLVINSFLAGVDVDPQLIVGDSLLVTQQGQLIQQHASNAAIVLRGSNVLTLLGVVGGPIQESVLSSGGNSIHIGQTGLAFGTNGQSTVLLNMGGNRLDNAGQILAAGASAVQFDSGANTFTNSGRVSARDSGVIADGPGSVVNNSGIIDGGVAGIYVAGNGLMLKNSGSISGGTGVWVVANDLNLVNTGAILGHAAGVSVQNALAAAISNLGTISSVVLDNATANISNAGTIVTGVSIGGWQGGAVTNLIVNTGSIGNGLAEAIGGSDQVEVISNAGTISGDINLRGGDDHFDGRSGRTLGRVDGGAGQDTVRGGVADERFLGGGGNDSLSGAAGNDTLEGGTGDDRLDGGVGDDDLQGGTENDSMVGGSGDDFLVGDQGADTLDGGRDADTMLGGDGNDVYYYDHIGDSVQELPAGGIDTIRTWGSIVMPPEVEILEILSAVAADAYGNALDNYILAGSGNNFINGGSGIDRLSYDRAVSSVTVDLALTTQQATGGSGTDTVVSVENLDGSPYDDTLSGNALANVIDGLKGNNLLSGGAGNDSLIAEGGNDTLNGGPGADWMAGGFGDDVYFIDNAGDAVTEAEFAGSGIDEVRAAGSYVLPSFVENLSITAAGAADGYGNSLNNRMVGGAGNNLLRGGPGDDTLTGAGGADNFVLNSLVGSDTITDFTSGVDRITLSQGTFRVGDLDNLAEGATSVAGPGGFAAAAELVVITGNISGTIDAPKAAQAIGSATGTYALNQRALFAVDNGVSSALYLYTAANTDNAVWPQELTLLAQLGNTPSTTVADYVFGP